MKGEKRVSPGSARGVIYVYHRPAFMKAEAELRQQILDRDAHNCQWRRIRLWGQPLPPVGGYWRCKGILEVHHRDRMEDGGTNEPANLITLCKKHHSRVHWAMRRESAAARGATLSGVIPAVRFEGPT